MRKVLYLFVVLVMFFGNIRANDIQHIKAMHDYSELISAIIAVESRGDVNAISKNGKCCGILQITPIMVKEVNNILGYEKYSLQDRFDKEKSIEMFYIVQHTHNPSHNFRRAIALWNRSERYYNKVLKHYNTLKAGQS